MKGDHKDVQINPESRSDTTQTDFHHITIATKTSEPWEFLVLHPPKGESLSPGPSTRRNPHVWSFGACGLTPSTEQDRSLRVPIPPSLGAANVRLDPSVHYYSCAHLTHPANRCPHRRPPEDLPLNNHCQSIYNFVSNCLRRSVTTRRNDFLTLRTIGTFKLSNYQHIVCC